MFARLEAGRRRQGPLKRRETKADSLAKAAADTECKRSVFDICGEAASKTELGVEFVPAMRSKVTRFEVVDEDEWQARLNEMSLREGA